MIEMPRLEHFKISFFLFVSTITVYKFHFHSPYTHFEEEFASLPLSSKDVLIGLDSTVGLNLALPLLAFNLTETLSECKLSRL